MGRGRTFEKDLKIGIGSAILKMRMRSYVVHCDTFKQTNNYAQSFVELKEIDSETVLFPMIEFSSHLN